MAGGSVAPKSSLVLSSSPQTPRQKPATSSVSMYSVQCNKCYKWRVISTQEEYEDIRKNSTDDPWFCNKIYNLSCEYPAEIEYDNTRTWIMDKQDIPKTPDGFKRTVVVRSDFSRCDLYYHLPTGSKVRSLPELQQFLKANPRYKSRVDISDFDFTRPKIMEDTIPTNVNEDVSSSKRTKR